MAADLRRLVAVAVGATALLAAGCASDPVESTIQTPLPPDMQSCDSYYEDGKIIDHSRDGDFGLACEEAGELVTPVPADLACQDGSDRRLVFNDYAWGFQGQEMTVFPADDTLRIPPEDVVTECLRQEGEDLVGEAEQEASEGEASGG